MATHGAPAGHPRCRTCLENPVEELRPCGHKVCERHIVTEDNVSVICGHCGAFVSEITTVNGRDTDVSPLQLPERLHAPRQPTPLRNMFTNSDNVREQGYGLGTGIGPGMGNNRFNLLAREDSVPSTPTPAARHRADNRGGTIKPSGVYVPPQRRGDPIPRPESTASNASFATQVPMQRSSFTSPHGSQYSSQQSTPTGPYRLAGAQLPHHMARLGMYDGAPRGPPPPGPFSSFDPTIRPPAPMNFNTSEYGPPSDRTIRPSPPMNSQAFEFGPGSEFLPLPQPGDDHATKAVKLADIIKRGWTEDPHDVDFGNPGPSKRVPPPAGKSPVMKVKRGDIAARAGQGSPSPRRGSKQVPNIDGNAVGFINVRDVRLPAWFHQIHRGFLPTYEQFWEVIPLMEPYLMCRPSTAGVVRINNMPYSTSRSEITALLGQQAKIVPQPPGTGFLAVHIFMERQSGKTLDAFVEVETVKEAQTLVSQFAGRAARNRPPKLGDRPVDVVLSNQDEMLAEMFPHAKNVKWVDGVPSIDNKTEYFYPDAPSTGFQGFMQDEEVYHIVKHAETPQRSPFTQRCLIRNFEYLTTTIHKYPWYALEHILESERARIFHATKLTIRALVNLLSKTHGNHRADPSKPTPNTLKELAVAALTCPGFSEKEKSQIVADLKGSGYHQLTRPHGMNVRFGGNHPWAEDWPFKVAAKHPGANDQMMEAFATLMRDATRGGGASVDDLLALHGASVNFGVVNINFDGCNTFADYARAEVRAIKGYVARVLPRIAPAPGPSAGGTNS